MWLTALVLGAAGQTALAAKAFLDHDTIYAGESVQLTLLADGEWAGVELDLKQLERDFQILGHTVGTQLRFEQGKLVSRTRWAIHLRPKHTGVLEIPSLSVGEEQTPALNLKVTEQSVEVLLSGTDVHFESEIHPKQPYVQAQILYTVRVWHTGNILEHDFIAPATSAGLFLQALGEERHYQAPRDGKDFHVIEQGYALFAEKSGPLAVPPITFRARIIYGQEDRKTRLRSRRITISTEPGTLQIRQQPDGFTGPWLPGKNLQIRLQWPDKISFQIGEPIVAKLILEGAGVRGFQLPAPEWSRLEHLHLYSETPAISTQITPAGLIGKWEQSLSLVPTGAGQIRLPQLALAWWDTVADTPRLSKSMTRVIQVNGAGSDRRIDSAETKTADLIEMPLQEVAYIRPNYWQLVSVVLLLLWLATLAAWLRERERKAMATPPILQTQADSFLPLVRRACLDNDPGNTAKALLSWARQHWTRHPPANLAALAQYWPHHSRDLLELDRALYGRTRPVWDGPAFWRRLQADLE